MAPFPAIVSSPPASETARALNAKAFHIAERLRLKEIRDKVRYEPLEFSNYEMLVSLGAQDAFLVVYTFGSVVFFNATDAEIEIEMARLKEFRSPSDAARTSDTFLVEISDAQQPKVFFDRVTVKSLSTDAVKIVCLILGQSTALEYYDILIEQLLEQSSKFSRKLQKEGRFSERSEDLMKFIGQCLNTKQEIITHLNVLDAPDEVWDNNDLDRLFLDLKHMLEIDSRYRALEYKIRIIQESIEILADLSKARRATQLEYIIIALISCEILISLSVHFLLK